MTQPVTKTKKTASGYGTYIHNYRIDRLIEVYRRPDTLNPLAMHTQEIVAFNDILRTRNGSYVRSMVQYGTRDVIFSDTAGIRTYRLPPIHLVGGTKDQIELFDRIISGVNRNEQFAKELARIYSGVPADPATGAPALPGATEGIFINALDASSPSIPIGTDKNTLIGGMAQPGPGGSSFYGATRIDGQLELTVSDWGYMSNPDTEKAGRVYFARHVIHEIFHYYSIHNIPRTPANAQQFSSMLSRTESDIRNSWQTDRTYGPSDTILADLKSHLKLDTATINDILATEHKNYGQGQWNYHRVALSRFFKTQVAAVGAVVVLTPQQYAELVKIGVLERVPGSTLSSGPQAYRVTAEVEKLGSTKQSNDEKAAAIRAEQIKLLNTALGELNATLDDFHVVPFSEEGAVTGSPGEDVRGILAALEQAQRDLEAIRELGTYGSLGSSIAAALARFLPGDRTVNQFVVSPILSAIGDNLFEVVANGSITQTLPSGRVRNVLADFDGELFSEIKGAGIGAVSAFLVSELVNAIGLEGIVGEGVQTLGTTVVSQVIHNIVSIAGGATDVSVFQNVVNGTAIASAAASFLGGKLADQIVTFDNVGGQIGSAIGAAFGAFDSGLFLAAAGVNPVTLALAVAWVAFWKIAGGFIGSLFGGTPRSGAGVTWDQGNGRFEVADAYARKGGSKQTAISLANAVTQTLNGVLEGSGGMLEQPSLVQSGNYGMRGKDFVYRPTNTRDKDAITQRWNGKKAAEEIVQFGTYTALTDPDFKLLGGDTFVKRALYNHLTLVGDYRNFSATGLATDLSVARDFGTYYANSASINLLLSAGSDDLFKAGWAITFARAEELGLNRRAKSDWYGGFSYLLDNVLGFNAARLQLQVETSVGAARTFIVFDEAGDYEGYFTDTIAAANQTHIKATADNDSIAFTRDPTRLDGTAVLGGVDRLESTAGFLVNGKLTDGSAITIDVAATIDTGAGNDVVHGGDMGNNIFGGEGDDTLYGGRLDDWLLGGDGNDFLQAGANGTLGGDGNYLDGGAGNDLIFGAEGSDWLEGGEGTDALDGGDGDDILSGGGDGYVNGVVTGDSLKGGHGDDQYLIRVGDGADTVDEVASETIVDTTSAVDKVRARYAGISAGTILKNWLGDDRDFREALKTVADQKVGVERKVAAAAAGGDDAIVFGQGIDIGDVRLKRLGGDNGADLQIDVMTIVDGAEVPSGTQVIVKSWFSDPFKRVEWLKFADGNEIRIADITSFIVGTDAADVIIGTNGNDFVYGGGGDDEIHLLDGDDIGNGGTGDDVVWGDGDRDLLIGGLGNDRLLGGTHDDALSGDAGDDELTGDSGNDRLSGGRGNDRLAGGIGSDTIKFSRGDGHDTILAEVLTDVENAANYEVVWTGTQNDDGDIVSEQWGQDFDERILQEGWAGRIFQRLVGNQLQLRRLRDGAAAAQAATTTNRDTIEFGLGIDIQDVVLSRNGTSLTLGISDENTDVSSSLLAGTSPTYGDDIRGDEKSAPVSNGGSITIQNWYHSDTVWTSSRPVGKIAFYQTGILELEGDNFTLIAGTDGNDGVEGAALTGTDGKDWITAGSGDDVVSGGGGDDILAGNGGFDALYGGEGADILYGGGGDDKLVGGAGTDTLIGGEGSDTASYAGTAAVTASLSQPGNNKGNAAGDSYFGIENLSGGDGNDNLGGDEGQNIIAGGLGNDALQGDTGDDVYLWSAGEGADVITEGQYSFTEVMTAEGVLLPGYTSHVDNTVEDTIPVQYMYFLRIMRGDEQIYHFQKMTRGSYGNDPKTWPASGWQAGYARTGNSYQVAQQTLVTATEAGSDTLELGEGIGFGNLSFTYSGGDLVIGHDGQAGSSITIRNQKTVGGAVETLQLHDGLSANLASLIIGGTGTDADDLVVGDAAPNTLDGGAGNDVMAGGAGNDVLSGGSGDDVLEGGAGADNIDGGANSTAAESPTGWGDTARYASSTAVDVDLRRDGEQYGGDAAGDVLAGIENVTGSSAGDDVLQGNDAANRIHGLDGNNTLYGWGGNDVLVTGTGADRLYGGGGEDGLSGGDGNDELRGGDDKDLLNGGAGSDTLYGDAGDDVLDGGADDDSVLDGGSGNDTVSGGAGRDILFGGEGDDLLSGGVGDDDLYGGAGGDRYVFDAHSGNDTIDDRSGVNRILVNDVTPDQLWMTRSGFDLKIAIIGGSSILTVRDYFADNGASLLREIATATHSLFLKGVSGTDYAEPLIAAMTAAGAVPASLANVPEAVKVRRDALWNTSGNAAPIVADKTFDMAERSDRDEPGNAVSLTGTVDAVDHDENLLGAASYALAQGPGHGTVTLNGPAAGGWTYVPDHYYNGADSFKISVTDDGGNVAVQTVTVNIAPVNSRPIFSDTQPALAVDENAAAGTAVATLLTSDVENDAVAFSIVDQDSAFQISSTGTLSVRNGSRLNFEAASDASVTIRVSDGVSAPVDRLFNIAIRDVNEAPDTLRIGASSNTIPTAGGLSINENVALGTVVGLLQANDPDRLKHNPVDLATMYITHEWQWLDNTPVPTGGNARVLQTGQYDIMDGGGVYNSARFAIDPNKAYKFSINVRADTSVDALALFGVTPSWFNGGAASVESASTGADAGNPYFVGLNQPQSLAVGRWYRIEGYVLPQGTPLVEGGVFGGVYDTVTGAKVANTETYRWNDTMGAASASMRFFNYHGAASGMSTSWYQPVVEQLPVFSGIAASGLSVDAATGLVRVAGSSPNFEAARNLSLTARATDAGGLFSDASFNIAVNNINEAPDRPLISGAPRAIVTEGAIGGTPIASFTTSDPDGGSPALRLRSGSSAAFAIEGATLKLANGYAVDFEGQVQSGAAMVDRDQDGLMEIELSAEVESFDGALASAEAARITVSVEDGNEAPQSLALAGSALAVERDHAPAGEVLAAVSLGLLSTVDSDLAAAGERHVYATSDTRFEIVNGNELRLRALAALDYEAAPVDAGNRRYTDVQITTTDRGGVGLSITRPVRIFISDRDDYHYGVPGQTVEGAWGRDIMFGGTGNQTLYGRAGNDELSGGEGDDRLFGNEGDDVLRGEAGNDVIEGGTGADRIDGGEGNDTVSFATSVGGNYGGGVYVNLETGGIGEGDASGDTIVNVENIVGGVGPDSLFGTAGANRLEGGAGGDFLHGRAGDDTLLGQSGNDELNGNEGDDSLDGGEGDDTIRDTYGRDTLIGGAGNDYLLSGERAWDIRDTLGDTLDGGAGNDSLYGAWGNDTLIGGAGDDYLESFGGDDVLKGGEGNDTLDGNYGQDTIEGGAGNDYVRDYEGNDTYVFDAASGSDTLVDNNGFNTMVFNGVTHDRIWLTKAGADLIVTVIGGASSVRIGGYFAPDWPTRVREIQTATHSLFLQHSGDLIDAMTALPVPASVAQIPAGVAQVAATMWATGSILRGSDAAESIFGTESNDTVDAAGGDDYVSSAGGNDTLYGGDGNDNIWARGGDDRLFGGNGNDRLYGNDQNDKIYGGAGNDHVAGGLHDDELHGGDGDDGVWGEEGVDTLFGGAGNDQLGGGILADTVSGGDGDDTIHLEVDAEDTVDGGAGIDTVHFGGAAVGVAVSLSDAAADKIVNVENIVGGNFNDALIGTAGANRIEGGAGNDVLWGLQGDDRLEGGAGDDSMVGGAGADQIDGGAGIDRVVYNVTAQGVAATQRTVVDLEAQSLNADGALGDFLTGVENLVGSAQDDVMSGDAAANTLWGQAGRDELNGRSGNDILLGEDGNDKLDGGDGADRLEGGAGLDILRGGFGDDVLVGGAGDDTYAFKRGDGNDIVDQSGSVPNTYDASGMAITGDNDVVGFELVGKESLWFRRDGNDVVIEVVGATTVDSSVRLLGYSTADAERRANIRVVLAGQNQTFALVIGKIADMMAQYSAATGLAPRTQAQFDALLANQTLVDGKTFQQNWNNFWTDNKVPTIAVDAGQAVALAAGIDEDSRNATPFTFNFQLTDDNPGPSRLAYTVKEVAEEGSKTLAPGLLSVDLPVVAADGAATVNIRTLANVAGTSQSPSSTKYLWFHAQDAGGLVGDHWAKIVVRAVADAPALQASNTAGNAGTDIALSIATQLTDIDGSESIVGVTIGKVPASFSFKGANNAAIGTRLADGRWSFTSSQLTGLKLVVPVGWSQDLTGALALEVTSTTQDGGPTGPTASTTVALGVRINAAPTSMGLSRSNINENVPVGTVVGMLQANDPDRLETNLVDNATLSLSMAEARWINTTGPDGAQVSALQTGQLTPDNWAGGTDVASPGQISVDPNKAYKFTVFLRSDSAADTLSFFGLSATWNNAAYGLGNTAYVERGDTGADDNDPYFTVLDTAARRSLLGEGKWYRLEGYVLPQGSALMGNDVAGGIFDVTTGAKVAATQLYRWNDTMPGTQVNLRFFNHYGPAGGYATSWYQPVVEQLPTFAHVSGAGLSVDTATGVVRVAGSSPNYEAVNNLSLSARATDAGGLSLDAGFNVAVNNVNEAPNRAAGPGRSFMDETGLGARPANAGATIATYALSDPDGTTPTMLFDYNLNGWFHIVGNEVRLNAGLNFDFEELLAQRGGVAYDFNGDGRRDISLGSVWVRTFDGELHGGVGQMSTEFFISDVNEAPNRAAGPGRSFMDETGLGARPANAGATVATYALSDPDGTTPTMLFDYNPNGWFHIVGNEVRLNAGLNFNFEELLAQRGGVAYDFNGDGRRDISLGSVWVRTFDGELHGGVGQMSTEFFISDVNERPDRPTLATQTLHSETVPGMASHEGQVVATFGLSDPDQTTPGLVIVSHSNPAGWNLFNTAGNQLKFSPGVNFTADWLRANIGQHGMDAGYYFDRDGDGIKEIRVSTLVLASQDEFGVRSDPFSYDVLIEDTHEAPRPLVLEAQNLFSETFAGEGAHSGNLIARFSLSDPDGSTPALRILGGNPNGWFTTTGNHVQFAAANFTADWLRGNRGQYGTDAGAYYDSDGDGLMETRVATLTLAAVDAQGLQSSPFTYNVLMEDRNEAPNPLVLEAQNLFSETFAGEGAHSGNLIARFTLSDPDGDTPALRILGGNANGWFTTTGNHVQFAAANFTADWLRGNRGQYGTDAGAYYDSDGDGLMETRVATLTLASVDARGLQSTPFTYNVLMEDRNEAPVFNAAAFTFGVAENPGWYQNVGQVSGSDIDGPAAELHYIFSNRGHYWDGNLSRWVSASQDNRFVMDALDGRVWTNGTPSLDYEAVRSLTYQTMIYDKSMQRHTLSNYGTLNIDVRNVNDIAPGQPNVQSWGTTSFNENTGAGVVVATLWAPNDGDGGTAAGFEFIDNPDGLFEFVGHSLRMRTDRTANYEAFANGGAATSVRIRYRANDGLYVSQEAAIDVQINNDVLQVMSAAGSLSGRYRAEFTSEQTGYDGGYTPQYWDGGYQTWYTEVRYIDNLTGATVLIDGSAGRGYHTTDRPIPDPAYAMIAQGFRWTGNGRELISDDETNGWSLAPIVFDLAGLGLENAFATAKVEFDVDGAGAKETVQWLNPRFGFLTLDRDGDGQVTSGLEISFVQDRAGAKTDLEGLAAFDSDGNGRIDAGDARFQEFRIWQDRNSDGRSEAGELRNLTQMGIVSISLAPTPTGRTLTNTGGNVILNTASFVRADGSLGGIGDAVLRSGDLGPAAAPVPGAATPAPAPVPGAATPAPAPVLTPAGAAAAGAADSPLVAMQAQSLARKSGKYRLVTGGGQMTMALSKDNGPLDPRAGLVAPAAMLSFRDKQVGYLAPIVLDLDGDGVELKSRTKSKARFDMDGNGSRDDTGWVGRDDGMLVLDLNGDGAITTAAELSLLTLKEGARNSLDALSALDSNKNGKIDDKDARFGELKVWVDRNGNGITDAGELASLTDHGIASIDLQQQATANTVKLGQNTVIATSTFTRADGSTGSVGDAALAFKPAASGVGRVLSSLVEASPGDLSPDVPLRADDSEAAGLGRREAMVANEPGSSDRVIEAVPLIDKAGYSVSSLPAERGGFISPDVAAQRQVESPLSDSAPATERLRAGLNRDGAVTGNFMAWMTPPAGMDPFEFYQRKDEVGEIPGSDIVIGEAENRQTSQDLPMLPLHVDGAQPATTSETPIVRYAGNERLVAQMIQHMASFGPQAGEADWKNRPQTADSGFDYYAG